MVVFLVVVRHVSVIVYMRAHGNVTIRVAFVDGICSTVYCCMTFHYFSSVGDQVKYVMLVAYRKGPRIVSMPTKSIRTRGVNLYISVVQLEFEFEFEFGGYLVVVFFSGRRKRQE